ncbi:flagellar hook capping protein [Sphingomonas deserti]|uniref:Basal-body rod modification protein FlgD n=1 Tax=Allosphingosinicella deserti TaxID=2116704 RepID=A0A2P7QWI8_9SPHN|nr:flagellar hook capping protein [Sphingomonas deserti]
MGGSSTAAAPTATVQDTASSAFGLSFDALLKIILTQLTYQDPLKPMDNFQFVSQLGQFSQIQQGQSTNDRLSQLVSAQGALQATSLLGRTVDIPAGTAVVTGKVTGIAFDNGDARLTIKTSDNQTISNIAMGSISQIREGN